MVAVPHSRGSSWPRDGTYLSCISCISASLPLALSGKPMETVNGRFSWVRDGNNIHHFHPHFTDHISVSARIQSGWQINVPSKNKKNVHMVSIDSAFLICNSDHYISILSGFPLRRQVPPRPCIKLNVWKWKLNVWKWKSSLSLCDPMDCSPPGCFVHEFSRQEYWSGLPFPSPGNLPDPGIEPRSLQADSLSFV